MVSESVNVRVTGELRKFIDIRIGNNGIYESASEYIRDLIRHDREQMIKEEQEIISNLLAHSMSSPTSTLDSDFFDKKREYLKKLEMKKT